MRKEAGLVSRKGYRFETVWGVAQRCYNDNGISGDNCLVYNVAQGTDVYGIADGMGSGESAGKDSRRVIEHLGRSVSQGLNAKDAITAVNLYMTRHGSLAVYPEDTTSPVALDMCVIDRLLGMAEFVKLGAASAYIKRNGIIDAIMSETLPIGVLESVDYDSIRKKIYGGDYIILVSDGVLEMLPSVDKEREFAAHLVKVTSQNPSAMAQEILEIICQKKPVCDDLTVMVIGIYENIM